MVQLTDARSRSDVDLSRVLPAVDPKRLVGIDVARALALLGMMATHLVVGASEWDVHWSHHLAAGRASALFAVLAGVGIALASGRSRPRQGAARYAASVRLVVRALLVAAAGLGLGVADSGIAVILTYYGLLFLLAVPFLGLRAPALAALAVGWVLLVPVLSHLVRPHLPVRELANPVPADLAHPWRLVTELGFTGYYPAVVWLGYVLVGMAVGRSNLASPGVAARLLAGGAVLAASATGASRWLLSRPGVHDLLEATNPQGGSLHGPKALDSMLASGLAGTTPTDSWWWLATVAPHSGTPLDLTQTIGSALAVIGAALLVTRWGARGWAVAFGAGAMTLTLYSLHVLMMASDAVPWLPAPDTFGDQVLVVLGTGAFFALVPLRGPLEALVAKVCAVVVGGVVPGGGRAQT